MPSLFPVTRDNHRKSFRDLLLNQGIFIKELAELLNNDSIVSINYCTMISVIKYWRKMLLLLSY